MYLELKIWNQLIPLRQLKGRFRIHLKVSKMALAICQHHFFLIDEYWLFSIPRTIIIHGGSKVWSNPNYECLKTSFNDTSKILFLCKRLGFFELYFDTQPCFYVAILTFEFWGCLFNDIYLSIGNWVLYKRGSDGDNSYFEFIIKFRIEIFVLLTLVSATF